MLAYRTCIHVQDGRDVPDGTSIKFTEQLEKDLAAVEGCDARIASGGGRMCVTMDRYEVTATSSLLMQGYCMFRTYMSGCMLFTL